MSLFMGMFFNLQHTLPSVDKSSQVPGMLPPLGIEQDLAAEERFLLVRCKLDALLQTFSLELLCIYNINVTIAL